MNELYNSFKMTAVSWLEILIGSDDKKCARLFNEIEGTLERKDSHEVALMFLILEWSINTEFEREKIHDVFKRNGKDALLRNILVLMEFEWEKPHQND